MEFSEWAEIKEDIKKEDTNQDTKGFKTPAEKTPMASRHLPRRKKKPMVSRICQEEYQQEETNGINNLLRRHYRRRNQWCQDNH